LKWNYGLNGEEERTKGCKNGCSTKPLSRKSVVLTSIEKERNDYIPQERNEYFWIYKKAI
jgi:hypothetical protein